MANPSQHLLPYDSYREAIARETARFADVVRGADPATPVPTCPGWTLAELIRHAGTLQRRFSVLLKQLVQEPPRSREVELGLPDSPEGYADWLARGGDEVADVLSATDPMAPMWAWGADQHARFWARRMLFEMLVHRVDAEWALGLDSVIDPAQAADGVEEFLVNLPCAGVFAPDVAKLRGDEEAIAFRPTDGEGAGDGAQWLVRLRQDGFGLDPAAGTEAAAHAVVRGAAADLLLLLYGRLRYDDAAFDVSGDTELLDRWFAHSVF